MVSWRIGVLACAAACGVAIAADNELTPRERAAGWRLLFDGKTYAGWIDPTKKSSPGDSFTIEGGCLKAMPKPRIVEDLFTEETWRDFELEFDWKISPGGNSGIKYKIQDHLFLMEPAAGVPGRFEDRVALSLRNRPAGRPDHGQDYVIGFEYQLLDNEKNADARKGANHQAGALYDAVAPSKSMSRPVGEFNHSRLVVKGEHAEHWLNGVKVVDTSLEAPEIASGASARWGEGSAVYEMLVKHPRKDCTISLQNHETAAWFKNIKIRRLE